ncbi:MAG: hypothetical protein IPK68_04590 [Bdellovibrionales bacterium]|nr:hypothetical protein [Bdellovibrionales bacterium]
MENLKPRQQIIDHFEKVFIHNDSWGSEVAQRAIQFFPEEKNRKGLLDSSQTARRKSPLE